MIGVNRDAVYCVTEWAEQFSAQKSITGVDTKIDLDSHVEIFIVNDNVKCYMIIAHTNECQWA